MTFQTEITLERFVREDRARVQREFDRVNKTMRERLEQFLNIDSVEVIEDNGATEYVPDRDEFVVALRVFIVGTWKVEDE